MIHKQQIMGMLVDACPSFAKRFAEGMAADYLDDSGNLLHYIALGDFARHILSLLSMGKLDEFPAGFAAVEAFHAEGDQYVREAATVGFLEALQNNAEHRGVEKSAFEKWLGPKSKKWWDRLEDFWKGDVTALRHID